jgi:hypothetical protein
MFRKKRQPAPFFKMPGAPYNPATGERAPLGRYETTGTLLATFQVIGDDPADPDQADNHSDYIVCRGFEPTADPRFRYLRDPASAGDSQPINVAKPYSLRGTFPYKRGHVLVAARIRTRLGENQGVASQYIGQPEDLEETIGLLRDDNDVAIAWLDISCLPRPGITFLNDSGEIAPAYAVMKITDDIAKSAGQPFSLIIDKADNNWSGLYLVNGPRAIANDRFGTGYFYTGEGEDQYALYNTANTPQPGEQWSPVPDSWLLHKNGPGFFILGGADGTKVNIIQRIPGQILVKNDSGSAVAAGATRTVAVWGGAAGSEADSLFNISVFNRSSVSWPNGKYGFVEVVNGQAYVSPHQT